MEREVKDELGLKKKHKLSELNERYRVKRKGLKTVIEELKQRVLAKSAKVSRYQQRIEQFRQNRIFDFDRKKMCAEFNGDGVIPSDVLIAQKSKRFWGEIWSVGKGHKREAEWLKDIKIELESNEHLQERVVISVEKVTKQCRKMPNWKAPGKDGVQGYWIKNRSNLYERNAVQTNKILIGDDSLPVWMTHGRTVLCQKDPRKGNAVENYRPITCLPLIWKFLTGRIAEEMYDYLEQEQSCQKNKKDADEEAVEQRINYLLIRLC